MADLFDIYGTQPPRPVGAAMAIPQQPPVEVTTVPTQDAPPANNYGGHHNPVTKFVGDLLDYYGDAWKHAPESAGNLISGAYDAVAHPGRTLANIGHLAEGVASKIGRPENLKYLFPMQATTIEGMKLSPQEADARARIEAPADAVGDYYKNRILHPLDTFRTDPVGAALDVSSVLGGAGGLVGTVGKGSTLGKVGEVVAETGKAVNPVAQTGLAAKLAAQTAEPVVSNTLGLTTGAGPTSIRAAAKAGAEGGEAAKSFTDNMRGNTPVEDIVDRARAAVAQLRKDRSDAYKAGMGDLAEDTKPLDFDKIDKALIEANGVGKFKGVSVEPKASSVLGEINDIVAQWRGLDPTEYHTAVGIDALKRSIGNIRNSTLPNTPERVAADRVYQAIRQQIVNQAPDYAKTMGAYEDASSKINEATRTLSLGEKVSGDTAARKLLSATRNNVQTNYGERQRLIDALAEKDPGLPYAIAGQALNSGTPRGLVARLVGTGGGALALASNPIYLGAVPAFVPRIVGEGAYLSGKGAGGARRLAETLGVDANAASNATAGALQGTRANRQIENYELARALMRANEKRAAR